MTKLEPRNGYILVQLHFAVDGVIAIPDSSKLNINDEAKRTRVEVKAVAPDVPFLLVPGDFILLRQNPNLFPVNDKPALALVAATSVLAIDREPRPLEIAG